jgi:predicted O-linked N-acetylglucosamine transferase (SPINDLY family)
MHAVGRNDACPCGSGLKFKKCCLLVRGTPRDLLRTAVQHIEAGLVKEAEAALEKMLSEQPDHPDALHLSGLVAVRLGNSARAVERIGRAIARSPDNAVYYNSLGILQGQRMRVGDALAAFRKALALRPQYPQALHNLALQLYGAGELDEAEGYYRQLLDLSPDFVTGQVNLASLLQAQGRLDEAARLYERALTFEPTSFNAHSGRLFNILYQPTALPGDLLAAARLLSEQLERPLATDKRAHSNTPDPERRLKVGYVSPDFRRHSIAHFIEPVLARHDHVGFEIFCYWTGAEADAVTERLMGMADHWVVARGLNEVVLAERIRADGIDILVDLSGHSAGNRLLAFGRKPSPVQITWMGFLGTTGFASMDYLLTDVVADPPGSGDEMYSEQLIRLRRTCMCYRPPSEAPRVAKLPALAKGFITFGSFNTPAKHNLSVLELWADILRALPSSQLLLKGRGLDTGQLRCRTLSVFANAGISAERIVLQPYEADSIAHLSRYDEVDIGLDPFPHNGVTTTCGALWMGVPVVALRGDRHSARMCASVLSSAGLPECVADTAGDYIQIAQALVSDLPRLAAMRDGLRDRLRASALMDEIGMTREVEAAFREAWHAWCIVGRA